jgi:glycine cleavage system regulatory protein
MWSLHVQTTFIITFIGDDRPGLVESLSEVVSEHNGNWLESRMSQLAGKFAGLISVSVPEESTEALQTALKNLSETGSISIRGISADAAQPAMADHGHMICLSILGPDRPGIVREIAAALSSQHINVVDMESYVSPAPMSAEMLFHARVEAQLPEQADLAELGDTLDAIANEMDVDVQLEPGT